MRRWLNENGFDTSEGLSEAAQAAACQQFLAKNIPLSPTEVLVSEPTEGLTLHISASLPLPSVSSPVPVGNDTTYLALQQQRLAAFETQQQQVISQMQQQYERSQQLNAQYREAMSVSDQLLLQEFQLRGVQLGYAALETKQAAFKSTVQAAEAGTLSGKAGAGESSSSA
ncbi:hypothetical protein [Sphaerothrix gracilis]|uniref:hypothetical protein n=1 Tax=Sphaerothrix gracilis TaxID=3151835 RepID=UPI0031FD01E5